MNEEALFTPRLLLRPPQEQDGTVFLETMALSRELHYPWIFPPLTRGPSAPTWPGCDAKITEGFY